MHGRAALLLALAAISVPSFAAAQHARGRARNPAVHPKQGSQETAPSTLHTGILRGVVLRQDSTTPAPYASVEVVDGNSKRFSNESGEFSFRLAPGRYHLRARQIGFAPHDTTVDVIEGRTTQPVVIRLAALAIRLVDVTVRRPQRCEAAGVDSAEQPILYGIVAAVRENALREMLLRRSYPFEYIVEDVQQSVPQGARGMIATAARSTVDTLGYRSDDVMPYRTGGTVFTDESDPRGAWERMRLPATADFANRAFIASHCFDYGFDDAGNYELHFEPLATLAVPDVEGSVTLDTTTYLIRTASVRLTRSADVARGFQRLEVRIEYAELAPRVAVPTVVTATQAFRTPAPDDAPFVATEIQRIRSLRFLNGVPTGAQREQQFAAVSDPSHARAAPGGAAQ
jgi:hypothetical protein